MSDLATDPGIFIRSMATRGSLGGLATTTKEVIDLMDAFGFDRVLVETVGVGQTQIEITAAADTVIVVLVPESGDAIQAMKAGLMEIADIFVVNKADRPGADRLVKDLRQGLHLRVGTVLESEPVYHGLDLARIRRKESGEEFKGPGWSPPVLSTVAQSGEGVEHLMDMIEAHRSWLEESGELEERRRARGKVRIQDVVDRELRRTAWHSDALLAVLDQGLDRIQKGKDTPYSVAWDIVNRLLR
jgi:LAO/AO transport system kinase